MEEFILQIMNDEFDVNLQDGSAEEIAAKIVGLRKLTLRGDFGMVDEMYSRWVERQKRGGDAVRFQHVERGEDDDDTDWDSDDLEDGEEDEKMEEAPPLVKVRKAKVRPEVDEDGFTKVIGKKKG